MHVWYCVTTARGRGTRVPFQLTWPSPLPSPPLDTTSQVNQPSQHPLHHRTTQPTAAYHKSIYNRLLLTYLCKILYISYIVLFSWFSKYNAAKLIATVYHSSLLNELLIISSCGRCRLDSMPNIASIKLYEPSKHTSAKQV